MKDEIYDISVRGRLRVINNLKKENLVSLVSNAEQQNLVESKCTHDQCLETKLRKQTEVLEKERESSDESVDETLLDS